MNSDDYLCPPGGSYELDFEAIGRIELDDGPETSLLEAVLGRSRTNTTDSKRSYVMASLPDRRLSISETSLRQG
jgi:hypothetical protein